MTKNKMEFIKAQIKNTLSMKDILDFYVGEPNRIGRYKCPFNFSESNHNLSIKGDHMCRCFSCSDNWDEIGFVQKLFNYATFSEALSRIAVDFGFDISNDIDEQAMKKINAMKEENQKKLKAKKDKEEFIKKLSNKIMKRQAELEQVIKENLPYNSKKIWVYAFTKHPDYVMLAQWQYQRNAMLLDVLSKCDTDDRTDFIYGIAPFVEDKEVRLDRTLDMIKQNVIKINKKGDVLYG